jgi:DHA1 family inner membrane transport protein
MFGAPFFTLLFAVYVKETYDDPRYLGFMLSAFSVGTVIGAAFYGWTGYRLPRRTIMLAFLLTVTVPYWPLALELPFAILLGITVVGGLFDGPINPLLVTVRLERIPFEMRGRVMASTSAVSQIFPPLTIPLAGYLVERYGLQTTVILYASLAQIITVAIAFNPIWGHMDDARPVSA